MEIDNTLTEKKWGLKLKIFISYATEDTDLFRIRDCVELLEMQDKIDHIYYWERDCKGGEKFDDYMRNRVKNSDVVVVFCSQKSLQSGPVMEEMDLREEFGKVIVPVFDTIEDLFPRLKGIRGVHYNNNTAKFCGDLYLLLTGKTAKYPERDDSVKVFEDVLSVGHAIINLKSTQIPIHVRSFSNAKLQPDLLTGLVNAVQSFRSELGELGEEDEMIEEIGYSSVKLLIASGEYSQLILILDKKPLTHFIKSGMDRFIRVFENKFKQELVNFRGNLGVFKGIEPMMDKILMTSINQPQKIAEDTSQKLGKLQQKIIKFAKGLVTSEHPSFFIASLATITMEREEVNFQKVNAAIFDLVQKEAIIPLYF